jgi:hypothetical protein
VNNFASVQLFSEIHLTRDIICCGFCYFCCCIEEVVVSAASDDDVVFADVVVAVYV